MTKNQSPEGEKPPDCFGELEKVFPVGRRGLRETPDDCMYHCSFKTSCLRAALAGKQGNSVEEELIQRGEDAGMIGFFERWSRKKRLHSKKSGERS